MMTRNAAKLTLDDLQKQMAITKDKDLKKLFEDPATA